MGDDMDGFDSFMDDMMGGEKAAADRIAALKAGAGKDEEDDEEDDEETSELFDAVRDDDEDMVEAFADDGGDLDAVDGKGNSPIHYASSDNMIEAIALLGGDIDKQNRSGDTALHLRAAEGDSENAQALIDSDARTDLKNKSGKTALQVAQANGHNDVVGILSDGDAPAPTPSSGGDDFDDFSSDDDGTDVLLSRVPQPIKQSALTEEDMDGFDDFGDAPSPEKKEAKKAAPKSNGDPGAGDEYAGKLFTTECKMGSNGLGISIAGPKPGAVLSGCFISKVRDGTVAFQNGNIKTGMMLYEVNGVKTTGMDKKQTSALMRKSEGKIKLKLRYCPKAFGFYDGGAEFRVASEMRQKNKVNATSAIASARADDRADSWYFGKQDRAIAAATVLNSSVGDFIVRAGSKSGTVVIVVNDNGIVANIQVTVSNDGSCKMTGSSFPSLDDVVEYLRANPQSSKKDGAPEYVLRRAASDQGEFYDFMSFQNGSLNIKPLKPPPGFNPKVAVPTAPSKSPTKKAKEKKEKKSKSKESKSKDADKSADVPAAETQETKSPVKDTKKRGSFFGKKKSSSSVADPPLAEVVEANPFSFPIVRVAIAKRDEPSYGMTFIGPENNGPRTGVFITRVKPDLPASREVDDEGKCVIKPGMRILGMNGKSVQEKSKTEAVEILQGGTLTCVMTLQLDPEGFAFYDNGALKAQLLAETEAIDEAAE